MKIIKIKDEQYIVVDDSEIKEGDWYLSSISGNVIQRSKRLDTIEGDKKITHSTQPLEQTTKEVWENSFKFYDYISLQEVKELIGEVDVEKKALKKYPIEIWGEEKSITRRLAFEDGYNQALEDNKEKKYTEEDMFRMFCLGNKLEKTNFDDENFSVFFNMFKFNMFKKHIQSIQPKTEWEVEIVNGKLKLK